MVHRILDQPPIAVEERVVDPPRVDSDRGDLVRLGTRRGESDLNLVEETQRVPIEGASA